VRGSIASALATAGSNPARTSLLLRHATTPASVWKAAGWEARCVIGLFALAAARFLRETWRKSARPSTANTLMTPHTRREIAQ